MRLKNHQRDRIVDGLVARAVKDIETALDAEENKLALAIYRSRIPEALEKAADKLNEQLPGMVFTSRVVNVRHPENIWMTVRMDFARVRPRNDDKFEGTCPDELLQQAIEWYQRKKELAQTRNLVQQDARAVVYSCNTVEQLKAAWPEVMPIVQEVMGTAVEKKRGLPAIDRSKLNAMFKLPVEHKEAA